VEGSLRRRALGAAADRRRWLWASLCDALRGRPPEAIRRVLHRVYPGRRFSDVQIDAISAGDRLTFEVVHDE
jgi:hypothetical protein